MEEGKEVMAKELDKEKKSKDGTKTGVVPDHELEGSDADTAYDADGNFVRPEGIEESSPKDDDQDGSDADTNNR